MRGRRAGSCPSANTDQQWSRGSVLLGFQRPAGAPQASGQTWLGWILLCPLLTVRTWEVSVFV